MLSTTEQTVLNVLREDVKRGVKLDEGTKQFMDNLIARESIGGNLIKTKDIDVLLGLLNKDASNVNEVLSMIDTTRGSSKGFKDLVDTTTAVLSRFTVVETAKYFVTQLEKEKDIHFEGAVEAAHRALTYLENNPVKKGISGYKNEFFNAVFPEDDPVNQEQKDLFELLNSHKKDAHALYYALLSITMDNYTRIVKELNTFVDRPNSYSKAVCLEVELLWEFSIGIIANLSTLICNSPFPLKPCNYWLHVIYDFFMFKCTEDLSKHFSRFPAQKGLKVYPNIQIHTDDYKTLANIEKRQEEAAENPIAHIFDLVRTLK